MSGMFAQNIKYFKIIGRVVTGYKQNKIQTNFKTVCLRKYFIVNEIVQLVLLGKKREKSVKHIHARFKYFFAFLWQDHFDFNFNFTTSFEGKFKLQMVGKTWFVVSQ